MIISLSGPSGIGKGFIKKELLKLYPFMKEIPWFTTRPYRPNERDSNRISVLPSEFDRIIKSKKLILVQNLYGYRYGTKKEELLPSQLIKITELHPCNLKKALKINPSILCIGFITSDFSLLHKRLSVVRKTESLIEIEQRIKSAKVEIKMILKQKNLFTKIVEITETSENLVFDQVLTVLNPYFKK
ncbi:MAG: hypothetical protein WC839_01955 [Candidatus Paceibacterota bacterium]